MACPRSNPEYFRGDEGEKFGPISPIPSPHQPFVSQPYYLQPAAPQCPSPPTIGASLPSHASLFREELRCALMHKPVPKSTTTDYVNTESSGGFAPDVWRGPTMWTNMTDILNVLVAISFLVIGFCIVSLNGKSDSQNTEHIMQMILTLPTLWPIVFAAVVGSTVKTWANFKVERGIRLSRLEALMGSHTFAGTIKTIILQRSITVSTVILLPIWAFSPLGSQAFLRGISRQPQFGTGTIPMSYLNYTMMERVNSQSPLMGASNYQDLSSQWNIMYSAAIMNRNMGLETTNIDATALTYGYGDLNGVGNNSKPTVVTNWRRDFEALVDRMGGLQNAAISSSQDMWGNILIPNLKRVPGYNSESPAQWLNVPWRETPMNHASMVGFPVRGIPRDFFGNVTFATTQTYYSFDCGEWNSSIWPIPPGHFMAGTAPWIEDHWHKLQYGGDNNLASNISSDIDLSTINSLDQTYAFAALLTLLPLPRAGFFIDTPDPILGIPTEGTCGSLPQRDIYFGQLGFQSTHFTTCRVNAMPVEMRVSCESRGATERLRCGVEKIRQQPPTGCSDQYNKTPFDHRTMGGIMISKMPLLLNLNLDNVRLGAITATEMVMWNPARVDGNWKYTVELGAMPIDVFSDRLTLLYNTVLDTAINTTLIMGNLVDFEHLESEFLEPQRAIAETVFPLEPRYMLNTPWIIIYFISSAIMFLAAVFALVLRSRCKAPEVLGYVSSLARGNEFFRARGIESTGRRTGMEVSKQLLNTEVRVGVARCWSIGGQGGGDEKSGQVGQIAFAPKDMVGDIKKGRMYI